MSFQERIQQMKVAEGTFKESGVQYPFIVLSKDFEPRLPNFVGLMQGTLLISEETPVEFRPYIFAHEIICNVQMFGAVGRCADALRIELSRVPETIKAAYIKFRRTFYEGLVQFYSSSDNEDFKLELHGSLQYLRAL